MRNSVHMELSTGFRIIEKTETMPVAKAEEILLSARGRCYYKAVRNDTQAQLIRQCLVCPSCGAVHRPSLPMLQHTMRAESVAMATGHFRKERIRLWASMQMSMFEEKKELQLSFPIHIPIWFKCRACGYTDRKDNAVRKIDMSLDGKRITVRCEVIDLQELLRSRLLPKGNVCLSFPLAECVTFDLARGRVYVRMQSANGDMLSCRDITAVPEWLNGGTFDHAFRENKALRRKMRCLFEQVWGCSLPFRECECDLAAFFKMTVFVGYPAQFYDGVPFAIGSYNIEKSFCASARRLHFAANIEREYSRSGLPQIKSVRRIIFSKPGLLFYIDEIRALQQVLGDVNRLCALLNDPDVFELVSALHMRPGMFAYLRDFSAIKGPAVLLQRLTEEWGPLAEYAIDYSCMSQAMRRQTQALWKKKQETETENPAFSLPVECPDTDICDCTVNGYQFVRLRSRNDYAQAGRALSNCLGEPGQSYPHVVCMRHKGRYVAAVSIHHKQVLQALGFDNTELDTASPEYAALQAWMRRFNLHWEDDSDLPHDMYDRFRALFNAADMPF